MPRQNFSWDRLPNALLAGLSNDLGFEGDTPLALRNAFGARPDDDFVQAAWPTLRDAWLTSDRAARAGVVDQLRDRNLGNLGNLTIGATDDSDQIEYLRSCRNSTTLRAVVLGALLAAGSAATEPCDVAPIRVSRPSRSKAWPQFTTALASTLSALDEDQFVVISRKDRPWYVQFVALGSFGMRAEMVSNSYLADTEQIPDESITTALALGWQNPTGDPDASTPEHDPDGSPNYFREWPQPVAFIDVARIAVDTLIDVLAAPHPGTLTYDARTASGMQLVLPSLGLKPESARPTSEADAQPSPQSAAEVTRQLLTVLRQVSGNDELDIDSDGDIPLRYGSAMVFVRALEDPPIVRVFSPALRDICAGVDLIQAVNQLNGQQLFVKWAVDDASVVASIDLFGDPLTTEHLLHACGVVGEIVNDFDEPLQERFGGRTFFGEYAPPKLHGDGGYL